MLDQGVAEKTTVCLIRSKSSNEVVWTKQSNLDLPQPLNITKIHLTGLIHNVMLSKLHNVGIILHPFSLGGVTEV